MDVCLKKKKKKKALAFHIGKQWLIPANSISFIQLHPKGLTGCLQIAHLQPFTIDLLFWSGLCTAALLWLFTVPAASGCAEYIFFFITSSPNFRCPWIPSSTYTLPQIIIVVASGGLQRPICVISCCKTRIKAWLTAAANLCGEISAFNVIGMLVHSLVEVK